MEWKRKIERKSKKIVRTRERNEKEKERERGIFGCLNECISNTANQLIHSQRETTSKSFPLLIRPSPITSIIEGTDSTKHSQFFVYETLSFFGHQCDQIIRNILIFGYQCDQIMYKKHSFFGRQCDQIGRRFAV
jgi:hypothetical protein